MDYFYRINLTQLIKRRHPSGRQPYSHKCSGLVRARLHPGSASSGLGFVGARVRRGAASFGDNAAGHDFSRAAKGPGAPSSRTCPTCPERSRREPSRRACPARSRREPVRGSEGGSLVRVAQALLPMRFKWNIPAQPRVAVLPDFAPRLRLFCPCCSRRWFRKAIAPAESPARQRFPGRAEVKRDSVIVNSGTGFDERGESLWCD